jgi:hypothetical protein
MACLINLHAVRYFVPKLAYRKLDPGVSREQ